MHGSYTHAKNPRRIHFEININESPEPYEAHAGHRFSIPRETLAQVVPDPTRQLDPDGLPELVAWIVARYERQAFPDNFNERTSKVIDKKIKPILRKMHQLRAVYVALNTWEELDLDRNYVLHLVGTISAENNKNPQLRAELDKGLGRIATALNNCNGIEVQETELRSEAIMTLDDTRQLARWHFEYISLADPENHER